LPILYDSPACNSLAFESLLACPRLPSANCADEPTPDSGGSGISSRANSKYANNNGELKGVLGRLTEWGQVGVKALSGVVGVKCEGIVSSV